MVTILLLLSLAFSGQIYADSSPELTRALNNEAKASESRNLTRETHPVLWNMVEELVLLADASMPRYISVHPIEHAVVSKHGNVHAELGNVGAWADVMGDLHICKEALTSLTYNEVRGALAVAVAETTQNKPVRLAKLGVTTFVATAVIVYSLNKYYKLELGSFVFSRRFFESTEDHMNRVKSELSLLLIPSLIATKLLSNKIQKNVDLEAAQIADNQNVIDGIVGLDRLKERYSKEGLFSRLAVKLNLEGMFNTLFYPIRAYTNKERVRYLQN